MVVLYALRENLSCLFNFLDADGDGVITKAEVVDALRALSGYNACVTAGLFDKEIALDASLPEYDLVALLRCFDRLAEWGASDEQQPSVLADARVVEPYEASRLILEFQTMQKGGTLQLASVPLFVGRMYPSSSTDTIVQFNSHLWHEHNRVPFAAVMWAYSVLPPPVTQDSDSAGDDLSEDLFSSQDELSADGGESDQNDVDAKPYTPNALEQFWFDLLPQKFTHEQLGVLKHKFLNLCGETSFFLLNRNSLTDAVYTVKHGDITEEEQERLAFIKEYIGHGVMSFPAFLLCLVGLKHETLGPTIPVTCGEDIKMAVDCVTVCTDEALLHKLKSIFHNSDGDGDERLAKDEVQLILQGIATSSGVPVDDITQAFREEVCDVEKVDLVRFIMGCRCLTSRYDIDLDVASILAAAGAESSGRAWGKKPPPLRPPPLLPPPPAPALSVSRPTRRSGYRSRSRSPSPQKPSRSPSPAAAPYRRSATRGGKRRSLELPKPKKLRKKALSEEQQQSSSKPMFRSPIVQITAPPPPPRQLKAAQSHQLLPAVVTAPQPGGLTPTGFFPGHLSSHKAYSDTCLCRPRHAAGIQLRADGGDGAYEDDATADLIRAVERRINNLREQENAQLNSLQEADRQRIKAEKERSHQLQAEHHTQTQAHQQKETKRK
eukprot:TRINITY_DN367_c1_g3_i3.p1 TRINITY_DN367_c1_g3~~TRINITY_DN367_c1_g3_i3.p1  ORF type:complete len:688 (+),score=171.03 TRINITY_DN367_c1_g3_i3:78-2066(+)